MQRLTRYGPTLALGAALALAGACSRHDRATTDTAGGTVENAPAAAPGYAAPGSGAPGSAAPLAPATPSTDSTTMAPPSGGGPPSAMTVPNALAMIGLANGAEIDAAKVAQEKATNADVKAFARMLVHDHQAMQKEADQLAKKDAITPQPPAQADQKRAESQQTTQQLTSAAKGAAFDRTFVQTMVDDHQKTLTDLQQMQRSVDNADLKALVAGAIPKVQAHLDRAQKLQSTLK